MITLSNSSFWLSFVLFFVGVLVAFFIPGHLALRKLDISFFQKFVLGTIIGMVLWGWQGFIFGYLGMRWLSYIYLAVTFLLWVKLYVKKDNFSFLKTFFFSKIDWLTSLLVLLGLFVQLSTAWFNGLLQKQGLYFCCGNPLDNILYVALTNQLVKHFPPYEPGMFGMYVQNYHYWSNLVLGELIRVFNLPLTNTQYQYSTFFISLFLGLSAIVFGQIIALGKNFIRWLIFFLYFSGDLADDILNDHTRLKAAKILAENKIDYLYLSTVYSIISPESYNFMQNVFENKKVTILKVSHEAVRRYLKENAQKEE